MVSMVVLFSGLRAGFAISLVVALHVGSFKLEWLSTVVIARWPDQQNSPIQSDLTICQGINK